MKPPPYVSMVLAPWIWLESLDDTALEWIARKGVSVERDGFRDVVRIAHDSGDLLSNPSFVDTMARLNDAGLAFGEDYKQGWAPADIMRELQARGGITASFTAIAWRGPGDWFTTVHELPGTAT